MTRPKLKNERVASGQCRSFNVPKGPVPENGKVRQDIETSLGAINVVVIRSLSDGPRRFCFNGDNSSLTVTVGTDRLQMPEPGEHGACSPQGLLRA